MDAPKYKMVAKEMMIKNYNMFHVHIKDIKKFNRNLSGFMACQHQSLRSNFTEIIKKFIGDLELGELKNGLHFILNK